MCLFSNRHHRSRPTPLAPSALPSISYWRAESPWLSPAKTPPIIILTEAVRAVSHIFLELSGHPTTAIHLCWASNSTHGSASFAWRVQSWSFLNQISLLNPWEAWRWDKAWWMTWQGWTEGSYLVNVHMVKTHLAFWESAIVDTTHIIPSCFPAYNPTFLSVRPRKMAYGPRLPRQMHSRFFACAFSGSPVNPLVRNCLSPPSWEMLLVKVRILKGCRATGLIVCVNLSKILGSTGPCMISSTNLFIWSCCCSCARTHLWSWLDNWSPSCVWYCNQL